METNSVVTAHDNNKGRWQANVTFLVGVLAAIFGVAAALIPTNEVSRSISFSQTGSALVTLQLVNPSPKQFSVTFPCESARASTHVHLIHTYINQRTQPLPFAIHPFTVRSDGKRVRIEILNAKTDRAVATTEWLTIPTQHSKNCILEASFQDSSLTIGHVGGTSSTRTLPKGQEIFVNGISFLPTDAETGRASFSVTTNPSNDRSTFDLHSLTIIGVMSCLLVYLSLTVPWRTLRHWVASLQVRRFPLLIFAIGVVAAFVGPPFYDDGWVLARSRLVAQDWSLSKALIDPYNFGAANVQGFAYESLIGLTVAQGNWIPLIRVFSILSFVISWLVVRRLAERYLPANVWIKPILLTWFATTGALWFPTIRAEPIISLLFAITLSAVAFWPPHRRPGLFVFLLIAVLGLALSTHQTGLVLLAGGIGPLGIWVLWHRKGAGRELTSGALMGFAVASATIFTNQNAEQALRELTRYSSLQRAFELDTGFFSESVRVFHALTIESQILLLWGCLAGAALLVLAGVGIRLRWLNGRLTMLAMLALGAPVGLAFTTTKWVWHAAALAIPSALALILILVTYESPTSKSTGQIRVRLFHNFEPKQATYWGLGACLLLLTALYATQVTNSLTVIQGIRSLISVLWVAPFALALLLSVIDGAKSPAVPSPRVEIPTLETSSRPWLAGSLPLFAVLICGLLYVDPPRTSVKDHDIFRFAYQNVAGIYSEDARCNTAAAAAGSYKLTESAWLDESGLFPPYVYLTVPCMMPPFIHAGVWANPHYSIDEDFGNQATFIGTVLDCPTDEANRVWECRDIPPSIMSREHAEEPHIR